MNKKADEYYNHLYHEAGRIRISRGDGSMSMWTNIVAAIDVDTYIEDSNIKNVVEDMLKSAPVITGSERNADVFVNVLSGHNSWTSCDCKRCKYKDTIKHVEEGGFTCEPEDGFVCPEGEYQTRVVITVIGDLRDRMKHQTHKEWNKFNNYIAKKINGKSGFYIRNCACVIKGY